MKLAIIGDLHYPDALTNPGPSSEEARNIYYKTFMEAFMSIEADYHISVGDLTHEGERSEFQAVMDMIKNNWTERRFLFVLGNHDTYTLPKAEIAALTGQQRYEAIDESEAVILLLDTAREERDDWSGTIDEEQLTWIEKQMNRRPDKPMLVIGHHPLYGTTARSTEEKMSLDPSLKLWPILEQWRGNGFYFNGHNHTHSIVKKEQWHFIQTASVLDSPAVRIVTVLDGEVQIETIKLANKAYTEWAAAFTGSMYDFDLIPGAEGDEADERLTVACDIAEDGKQVELK